MKIFLIAPLILASIFTAQTTSIHGIQATARDGGSTRNAGAVSSATARDGGSTRNAGAVSSDDGRQVADFPPPIKQALKQRMRENLAHVQEIQTALASADFTRAAEVAEYKLGLSSLGPHNARQAPYMPPSMQHLGMGMHSAASRFAVVAQEGDMQRALEGLAEITAHCVACHATYRAK